MSSRFGSVGIKPHIPSREEMEDTLRYSTFLAKLPSPEEEIVTLEQDVAFWDERVRKLVGKCEALGNDLLDACLLDGFTALEAAANISADIGE